MAKAKKSNQSQGATGGKAPARKPAPAASGQRPVVDTSIAAQLAARMVAARAAGLGTVPPSGGHETSAFKQMKEHLAKPHLAGVNSFLNSTAAPGTQKLPLSHGINKQVGHNQTFGADATRTGIPRRTSG